MIYLIFCVVFLFLCFEIIYYVKCSKFDLVESDNSNTSKRIPGPTPLPFVGNALPLLWTQVHHYLMNLASQYGQILLLWLGFRPFVIVADKEAIRSIFVRTSHATDNEGNVSYPKGFFADVMRPLVGNGLLTSEGSVWKVHHKLATAAFQPARYKDFIPGMATQVATMLDRWGAEFCNPQRCMNLPTEMSRLTLDIIGVAAFGEAFHAILDEDQSIFHEVSTILGIMQQNAEHLFPTLQTAITKAYHRITSGRKPSLFDQCNDKIHRIVRQKIAKRRTELQTQHQVSNCKYLLDTMLLSQEEYSLTDQEIEDELITWTMGGHETTASLLSWFFCMLDTHPQVKARVLEEQRTLLAFQPPTVTLQDGTQLVVPSYDSLQKMDYLQMVLLETLRLYPSAPLLNRVTSGDTVLAGYRVPAQTQLIISPWSLQHNGEYWTNPEEFSPERFQKGDHPHGFNFLAFGAGPRACLGKTFALLEAKLVGCMVMQKYHLQVVDKSTLQTEVAITLRPKGGRMECMIRDVC